MNGMKSRYDCTAPTIYNQEKKLIIPLHAPVAGPCIRLKSVSFQENTIFRNIAVLPKN
jgi:hypothetical protein